VSLASIVAAITSMLLCWFSNDWQYIGLIMVLAPFVIWKHRANIQRIKNGTEPKAFQKKRP
ncbi:MAG: glycerol-3-phosphate acyltransferase, partial [Bacilli bacterium]